MNVFIRSLSDDGPDHPQWVAALCPNRHRLAHHFNDTDKFNVDQSVNCVLF
jgi:5-methylcytosine-specific restriction protein A